MSDADMPMTDPGLRPRLEGEAPVIGCWLMSTSPAAAEVLAYAGFDFVVVDMEHSPLTVTDLVGVLRALAATGCPAVIRLASHDPVVVKRVLDVGAVNLMFPMVETAEQTAAIVASTRYAPEGTRGFAVMHRASRYGFNPEFLAGANDSITVIVQLETPAALERLPEIARVEGVDAVFVGPGDLSASLGIPGQVQHPRVVDRIRGALHEARRAGVAAGVLAANLDIGRERLADGYRFVAVGSDLSLLARTARQTVDRLREAVRVGDGEH